MYFIKYLLLLFTSYCLYANVREKNYEVIKGPEVRIAQVIQGKAIIRNYPYALTTLLKFIKKNTSLNVNENVDIISSFEDEKIFLYPFIYVNFADRKDWTFSNQEKINLKKYLKRGGFIFIDAGINASFLRGNSSLGQHHSYAAWDASPILKDAFKSVFPSKSFRALKHSHQIFKTFYVGLPDSDILPDTVKEFVVNEKWPQGTYSSVAITLNGRIGVLATPIIAMGWGKNYSGQWSTYIRFRIREKTTGLSDYLQKASYNGSRFEVMREEGTKDIVYCQKNALPAWVNEPNKKWRVFRYYQSREISDFAHEFYTRLGTNILLYAITH